MKRFKREKGKFLVDGIKENGQRDQQLADSVGSDSINGSIQAHYKGEITTFQRDGTFIRKLVFFFLIFTMALLTACNNGHYEFRSDCADGSKHVYRTQDNYKEEVMTMASAMEAKGCNILIIEVTRNQKDTIYQSQGMKGIGFEVHPDFKKEKDGIYRLQNPKFVGIKGDTIIVSPDDPLITLIKATIK